MLGRTSFRATVAGFQSLVRTGCVPRCTAAMGPMADTPIGAATVTRGGALATKGGAFADTFGPGTPPSQSRPSTCPKQTPDGQQQTRDATAHDGPWNRWDRNSTQALIIAYAREQRPVGTVPRMGLQISHKGIEVG